MKDKVKIRIRPSVVRKGLWYAFLVVDKLRDRHGVVQAPVGSASGYGETPEEAYKDLQRGM